MKYQDEVVSSLKQFASDVSYFAGVGWWHFRYGDFPMVYIPGDESLNMIRICIPHLDNAAAYGNELLATAINEANREIKYVKIVVLGNNSISINYDHKCDGENVHAIVLHMLKTLCIAAEYLKNKLFEK